MGFCSTSYTWIFLLLILPLISLANWIILVRDTSFLSRVLQSILRDIRLYSNNRVFYNQQLSAFKFYRTFRIVSLVSLFFIFLTQVGFFVGGIIRMVIHDTCYIHLQNNVNISVSGQTQSPLLIRYFIASMDTLFLILYAAFLCLPVCGITFIPVIIKCVKRCREKEDHYRYNYEKLEPLLKKYY